MALNLYDYTTLKQYFATLATSHVDIVGFKFGDIDVIINDLKSDFPLPLLWLQPPGASSVLDPLSDNHTGNLKTAFYIFDRATEETFALRQAKYVTLEGIAKDILSKMLQDWTAGIINTRFADVVFGPVEDIKGATCLMGCRVDISFQVPMRLIYNELKWA